MGTYRSIAAVIIIRLIGKTTSNLIIHSLVVLLRRDKVLGSCRGITTLQVEVRARTGSGDTSPEQTVGRLALRRRGLGGKATTRGAPEGLRGQGITSATSGWSERRGCWGRTEDGPGCSSCGECHDGCVISMDE